MHVTNYQVITDKDPVTLAANVNEAISQGWQPLGGINVVHYLVWDMIAEEVHEYTQAMVKPASLEFESAVTVVRSLLDTMTDEQRIEAVSNFCLACGGKHLPCYCQHDE